MVNSITGGPGGRRQPRKGDRLHAWEVIPAHILEVIMDYEMIMNFITTLGFPIVVCCALFWYINKMSESHKEEIESLRSTITDNTTLLHEVKELISALIQRERS